MRFTVSIDQKAAVSQGIDAPHSTGTIEIDPAVLRPWARDYVAGHLKQGHDLTTAPNLTLLEPTTEQFVAALARLEAAALEKEAQAQAKRDTEDAEAREILQAGIQYESKVLNVARGSHDVPSIVSWDASRRFPVAQYPQDLPRYQAIHDPELQAEWKLRAAEIKEAIDAIHADVLRRAAEQIAIEKQEEAAKAQAAKEQAVREKVEFEKYVQQLPAVIQSRYRAGFASEDEIRDAVCTLIRAELGWSGLSETHGYEDSDPGGEHVRERTTGIVLTDDEFVRLPAIRAKFTGDDIVQDVTAVVREWHYRLATDADDPDTIDEDGEVKVPTELLGNYLRLSTCRAGMDLEAWVPLTEGTVQQIQNDGCCGVPIAALQSMWDRGDA